MIRRLFGFRLVHDARTAAELAHVRPAYAAGVRAAIASVAPLVLRDVLPGGGASWASLAGLNGALGDRGGPYRTRAALMSALAVSSATAALIGCLVAGHPVLSVAIAFVLAMICGLARAWNDVGPGFGVAILVTFSISLAVPAATVSAALTRAAYVAAGGLWAMLLAIVLWPIRPYRPVRLRITECYRAIARYLEATAAGIQDHSYSQWMIKSHLVAVRTAIENARTALAVSRRGRSGESGRGERLLVLHEIADQLYVHIIAFLEESDLVLTADTPSETRTLFASTLNDVATIARGIATAVESERDLPRVTFDISGAALRSTSTQMAEIVDRIADYATTAAELAASLNSGAKAPLAVAAIDIAEPPPEPVLFSLSAVLRPSSVVLHHALRVAIMTSIAVLITNVFHLNHGYWVTLTVVVILQPFAATTRQKALQRVTGTILGGIVAAGLSAYFHGGIALLVLVALFTMSCVALLPLNYGAYAVFGTPAFVLLAEASAGDWHLAGVRIVNTLIGGGLALLGAQLLWPADERDRLPELVAAALRANDHLIRRAVALLAGTMPGDVGALRDARREVALAATNAEDSFQRLVSEHRGSIDTLEPLMTFLVYTRRIAASSVALVVATDTGARPAEHEVAPFAGAMHVVFNDLIDAVLNRRAPAPFPSIGSIAMPLAATLPVAHQRLTRLARQLRLMHGAIARWTVPGDEPKVSTH